VTGNTDSESWGHLASRYSDDRPRRMLALDGGGIRGLLSLQVVARLESELREHYGRGDDFRLSQFFDFIGGTSTGAIVAAALARGKSTAEVLEFYQEFGAAAFTKRKWYARWKSLYGQGNLAKKLQEVFSPEATLHPEFLETLLLVVTRNATTDSAWPITSNPLAKYNRTDRLDCNLDIPLWKLVRASTAAPVYFPPEVIQWDENDDEKAFVFVDGGTTPYNNPAFLMVRKATEPAYHLNWRRGEKNLLVVSIGTGSSPVLGNSADDPESNFLAGAINTLKATMQQVQVDQDVNCRTVGRCSFGGHLDRELGDLVQRDAAGTPIPLTEDLGRAFLYTRYDAELTADGLRDLGIHGVDPEAVRSLDSIDEMDNLAKIGQALATHVDLAHFGSFVDAPLHEAGPR
jgi:Patatin-like phospholipase